ncbi:hypothetical protein GF357_03730, partial [Candidatus Dojkabacteria bacterium]|nr:hypothetical protein [Candidatus Dojkabacteria bacterium]
MRNKEISANNQKMVSELLDHVQNMSINEYKEILDSMALFRNYSHSNQIILHLAGASQVAGYKQWQKEY